MSEQQRVAPEHLDFYLQEEGCPLLRSTPLSSSQRLLKIENEMVPTLGKISGTLPPSLRCCSGTLSLILFGPL